MRSAATKFVLVCVLLLAAQSLRAQWNTMEPNLIDMPQVEMVGFKHFAGHTWAGTFRLFESLDSGATWVPHDDFPLQDKDYIRDISLFDTNNILVTGAFGVYTSTNGGKSWRILVRMDDIQEAMAGTFCGSPDTLAVIDHAGTAWQSTNAGATWKPTQLNSVAQKIFYHDGVLYAMTGIGLSTIGVAFKSTDGGTSWQQLSGDFNQDCYDLVYYRCQDELVATYEAVNSAPDDPSQIVVSTDDGASWQVSITGKTNGNGIAGGLCAAERCVFATTVSDGILRLTGTTWQTITPKVGGPRMQRDTRTICAIDDNIILLIDANGNILRTTNSGGVPIPGNYVAPKLLTTSLFQGSTITPCDEPRQAAIIAPFSGTTCEPPHITSQRIVGPDADVYTLDRISDASLTALDSDVIAFHPGTAPQSYNDTLVIELSDGTDWRVPLLAKGVDSSLSVHLDLADVRTDTIGDVTSPITGRITQPLEAELSFDTSMLVLQSVTDDSGRAIEKWIGGDRVKLTFADAGGIAEDTVLATMHFQFYPTTRQCASLSIGSLKFADPLICASKSGSTASVCFTGSCGNVLYSNFMRYNSALRFQIVPNPANEEAIVVGQKGSDLTICVFDAAGVLRKTQQDPKIDLSNLPQGVYLVRVQNGEAQATLRLVHMRN